MDDLTKPGGTMRRLHRRARRIRLRPSEQLEAPASFAAPAGWLAFLGLACLTATLALWATLGRIPVTVKGSGELRTPSAQTNQGDLEAVVSFPTSGAEPIMPGMKARVSPTTVSSRAYGELLGEVMHVATIPLRRDHGGSESGPEEPSRGRAQDGDRLVAFIRLVTDHGTASGYRWTFSKGPPAKIRDGTPCTATVTLAERHPTELWRARLEGRLGIRALPQASEAPK